MYDNDKQITQPQMYSDLPICTLLPADLVFIELFYHLSLFITIYFFSVPEMLAMMVDLEDDPEWSVSDDLDDEDAER